MTRKYTRLDLQGRFERYLKRKTSDHIYHRALSELRRRHPEEFEEIRSQIEREEVPIQPLYKGPEGYSDRSGIGLSTFSREGLGPNQGWVYLLDSSTGLSKIGFTTQPRNRISSHQKSNPSARLVGTLPGTSALEYTIHEELKTFRLEGSRDWFNLDEEDATCQKWLKAFSSGLLPEE